jgi:putative phage-type endonuclease
MKLIAASNITREDWLSVRRGGIGGSDVSTVVGLNKYKSPYVLWREKRGEIADDEQSEAAYWGTELEGVVAGEFARRTGFIVERTPGTFQHSEHEFMLVNPDGFIYDAAEWEDWGGCAGAKPNSVALLECKTTSVYMAEQWEDDQLPYAAALQVQHALEVTGLDLAYVPALIGGQRFIIIEVKRDQELIDMLIEREREFWRRVVENDPPEVDGEESTGKFLNKAYDVEPAKSVELPASVLELIAQRQVVDHSMTETKKRKAEIENRLKVLLGDAEIGTYAGQEIITWKESPREGYTVAPTTVRTLRISKKALQG